MATKAKSFWLDNNLYWSNEYLNNKNLTILSKKVSGTKINEYLNALNSQVYIVIFAIALIGIISLIKNKYDQRINVFIILLSAYFIVCLLIEIMNRYTYTPRVAIFILAGIGFEYLSNKFKVKKKKKFLNKKSS